MSDLRSTLNLPKTDFPMKANLSQAEPRRLEQWKAQDLYGQIRAARKGRASFVLLRREGERPRNPERR